ncbi:Aclacinomycin methylesterase RdmC [Paraconexibacter sp. AEG42_29]|uniref:Aclacinomycin methylesterase RdmC n=1 Tax=Paraconexibacter sp. AEG42_29 TaxID=2997339 RepID=A0AAU7AVF9_9ACTN
MDLHFTRGGTGEPLLLIQGMSGTHKSWGDEFLTALAPDFDVVAYDHRGIGLSPAVDEGFSIVDLADDAAALLDRLGWESAHVLGISMGGMVAQELALRHGSRIRSLTLGCTYCGGPQSVMTGPETMQKLGAAMTSGDRELAFRAGYECNVSAGYRADPAHFEAFRQMALAAPAKVATIMLQMQAIAGHDTSARLPGVDRPTLVLHGTEDLMLPAANGELIASLIPGARLELWDGVGHMFWWEQPERSAAALKAHALG